jgi:hypothetical protein
MYPSEGYYEALSDDWTANVTQSSLDKPKSVHGPFWAGAWITSQQNGDRAQRFYTPHEGRGVADISVSQSNAPFLMLRSLGIVAASFF